MLPTPPADLIVTDVSAPATAVGGDTVTIGWTVQNQGNQATNRNEWIDSIYLSSHPDPNHPDAQSWSLGSVGRSGALGIGESYTAEATFDLSPEISGEYVIVVTDTGDPGVYEGPFENNNTQSTPSSVSAFATADLQITDISLPATSLSGEAVDVSWTVTNRGAPVWSGTTYWTEYVYLSRLPEFRLDGCTHLVKGIGGRRPLKAAELLRQHGADQIRPGAE